MEAEQEYDADSHEWPGAAKASLSIGIGGGRREAIWLVVSVRQQQCRSDTTSKLSGVVKK